MRLLLAKLIELIFGVKINCIELITENEYYKENNDENNK